MMADGCTTCCSLFLIALLAIDPLQLSPVQSTIVRSVRTKRNIYHLCGIFPDMFYSTTPCYYTEQFCSNGGRSLGAIRCNQSTDCNSNFGRQAVCIEQKCCTIPEQEHNNQLDLTGGYCPNGQISQVQCNSKQHCGGYQICLNGLCCTVTEFDYRYPCGGITALASCKTEKCANAAICTASGYCCECEYGMSGGQCNQGYCPYGFTCTANGFCCATCPSNKTPYGACRFGVCGGNRTCIPGNICC